MNQFNFKIQKPIKGIKEENHYKNAISSLEEFPENGEEYGMEDGYLVKSLNDKIKILEKELQKAREESFQAGYQEGKESAAQEADRKIESVKSQMTELENQYKETIEKMDLPLLGLAKKMAKEVLKIELKIRDDHDEVLLNRLREMLYEVVDQNRIMIKVNPNHLEKLKKNDLSQELGLPDQMEISYIADKTLNEGEAVITSEDYHVDGTYENQLDEMEEQLRDEDS